MTWSTHNNIAMDDTYEAFNNELRAGQYHAEALVRHLNRMGAAKGTILVENDGRRYLVCVEEATAVRVEPPCKN